MSDVTISDAFFDDLGQNPAVVAAVQATAEMIGARARATAPVDSGAYRASIKVERADRSGRVAYLVTSDDPAALVIESRTGNLAKATR